MFDKIFKRIYKSRKTIDKEDAIRLQNDIKILEELVNKRLKQIQKFKDLIVSDPEHKGKYLERINVHEALIKEHKRKIKKIEMILLDS